MLANHRLWHPLALRLGLRYRCIVPDWPLGAHRLPMHPKADLSPKGMIKVILEFMDALGLDHPTLIGNDSGGALCQMLVAAHPERVGRLILTSCDAYNIWLPLLFKYLELSAFVPGGLFALGQSMRIKPLRKLPIAFGWLAKRMPPEVADAFAKPMLESAAVRHDAAKFLRGISARHTRAASKKFAKFPAPVLIAWSREDRFFPTRYAERLQKAFPQARLEYIDDAYTFSPLDNPQQLASKLRGFLLESARYSSED